jgi:hypothetical protein
MRELISAWDYLAIAVEQPLRSAATVASMSPDDTAAAALAIHTVSYATPDVIAATAAALIPEVAAAAAAVLYIAARAPSVAAAAAAAPPAVPGHVQQQGRQAHQTG